MSQRQADLLAELAGRKTPLRLSDANSQFGSWAVGRLRGQGWAVTVDGSVDRDPLADLEIPPTQPARLTSTQAGAAEAVRKAIGLRDGTSFLLEGVTGSGKTEVYLDAVEACVASGRRAIVMVPEIALTHQTIERLVGRFPGAVAVQHSGLSVGERYDQWWKIRRGEYDVVVGVRSAIFAPVPDLGLVVVDEEHEWTYKQAEPEPRYHARDVALALTHLSKVVVLMGSASPDVATFRRALGGNHTHLRLPERVVVGPDGEVGSAPLAEVYIVDMRRELREGHDHFLSRSLLEALEKVLRGGGKAILFLNRRGAHSHLGCRRCGYGARCHRCEVLMTFHQVRVDPDAPAGVRDGFLLCHYCGGRRRVPAICPSCSEHALESYGFGTQAVERDVARRHPEARVIRWDADAVRRARDASRVTDEFRQEGPAVLMGTQVVAKGLHFPDVTLVGVVLADVGLHVPDYRSAERTFQLISQVSGRAGRGTKPGRVIVQTYRPESYAIVAAANQDYRTFYDREIEHRRTMGNPPFSKLIRLTFINTNSAAAERAATSYGEALRSARDERGAAGPNVMGPTPGYPARLRGRYQWQLNIRGTDPGSIFEWIRLPPGVRVDVDPAEA